jgi:hypothetical protein
VTCGQDSRRVRDWRRYRSAFSEAIGLPAMSEHLPGVTMKRCSRPSDVVDEAANRRAVISGQDLEFQVVFRYDIRALGR